MLVTFALVEGPDYRIACTYDDVTLAVQQIAVDQTRPEDAPARLWIKLPIVGETTREVRESSAIKTIAIAGVFLEEVVDARGTRIRFPGGVMVGGGA